MSSAAIRCALGRSRMKWMTRKVACCSVVLVLAAAPTIGSAQASGDAKSTGPETSSLCLRNETPAVSFSISGSRKIASVCKGADNDYLVYRFGRPGHIELQYPERPTLNSWAQFELRVSQPTETYDPGRALESVLTFENQGFRYRIFERLDVARDTQDIVMMVEGPDVGSRLKGDPAHVIGSIASLKSELSWQYAEDDAVKAPRQGWQAGYSTQAAAEAADEAAAAADQAAAEVERYSHP